MSPLSTIKLEKFELLDSEQALNELDLLSGLHTDLPQLFQLTEAAGFTELAGSAIGWRYTVEAATEIAPGAGESGDPVTSLTSQAVFKGYTGGGGASPDQLAVGTVTNEAGSNKYAEHIQLLARDSNLDRMIERQVAGSGLVVVDGWWDRFRGCLGILGP